MNLQLTEGLLKLGDSVTAVYKRMSRASVEEKNQAGFRDEEEVLASVGIANIEEYATMSVENIPKRHKAVFDLAKFGQAMRVVSLYINDPKEDSINIELYLPDGTEITEQRFSKNKTPIAFPDIPLPPNVTIKVEALNPLEFILMVLKPVVILESLSGVIEDEDGNISVVFVSPEPESEEA